jgi:hypothetical protein
MHDLDPTGESPLPPRPRRRGHGARIALGAVAAFAAALAVVVATHSGGPASLSSAGGAAGQAVDSASGGDSMVLAASTPTAAATPATTPSSNENPGHEAGESATQEQAENSGQGHHGNCPNMGSHATPSPSASPGG